MKRRILLGILSLMVVASSFAGCSAKDDMKSPVSPSAIASDINEAGANGNMMTSTPTADATPSADTK